MTADQVRRVLEAFGMTATDAEVEALIDHVTTAHDRRRTERDAFMVWAQERLNAAAADLAERYGAEVYFDGTPL